MIGYAGPRRDGAALLASLAVCCGAAAAGSEAQPEARWVVAAVGGANAGDQAADATVHPLHITRGPWLQQMTPTSVIVRWHTSFPVSGALLVIGLEDGSVRTLHTQPPPSEHAGDAAGDTTEHFVLIDGLAPGHHWSYTVLAGGTPLAAPHVFRTPSDDPEPMRIWAIGDSGTGNDNARAVRDSAAAFLHDHPADLWLMLGDNAYEDGTDAQYQPVIT